MVPYIYFNFYFPIAENVSFVLQLKKIKTKRILFYTGLNCMRCVNKVQSSFEPENSVQVNLAQGKAFCSKPKPQEREVMETIQSLGFKAYAITPHQGRVKLQVGLKNAF